jgi:hypothetical protein
MRLSRISDSNVYVLFLNDEREGVAQNQTSPRFLDEIDRNVDLVVREARRGGKDSFFFFLGRCIMYTCVLTKFRCDWTCYSITGKVFQ